MEKLTICMEPVPDELVRMLKVTAPNGVTVQDFKVTALSAGGSEWLSVAIRLADPLTDLAIGVAANWIFQTAKEYLAQWPPNKAENIRIEDRPLHGLDQERLRQLLRAKAEE